MNYSTPNDQLNFVVKEKTYQYGISKQTVPSYITENIRHPLWFWQKEALEMFLTNELIRTYEKNNEPNHLMFNMATGTGKTLLMGALILYYYKKGYQHFIFFVNQNNIVDKTENNFINKQHTKYLFRQNIVIENKTINIRKVETFDDTDDIQIKITSIHKLHNAIYLTKENSVTLEDLQKKDLVMIGDEAHHLNASTIRNSQMEMDLPLELKENASEKDIEKSWENTVRNKILRKGKNKQDTKNRNVLLEFTATIPKNADVIEKYRTKTIYKFELVDFLNAGYTKEINLVSTSLNKKKKILLALLFNWYRNQIALKNNIANFKPVILFRSKLIEESKRDYKYFLELISDLTQTDFGFLKNVESSIKADQTNSSKIYEQGKSRIKQMLGFIKAEKVNIAEIVSYMRDEFVERNCIITNSKDNKATTKEKTTEEQEQLLNSLEDKNNHIRAIFTVKRLTEGWDVLNLFDIIRLYEGRDEGHQNGQRVAGQSTVQEIQLIGRGVRYFPFNYNEQEKNKRKFDNDLENPMRVLEEFYYHSDDDVDYLSELKRELKHQGFIQDNRKKKKFELKKSFKDSVFFKEIKIWKNERVDNPERRKRTLTELTKDFVFEYKTGELSLKTERINLDQDADEITTETRTIEHKTISVKLSDFEKHIVAKAINKKATNDLSLLRFESLQNELVIQGVDDLLSDDFIGNVKINIITSKSNFDNITNEEKLGILLNFFDEFTRKLKEIANPYIGTEFKHFSFEELFGEPKEKLINLDKYNQNLVNTFREHKWFVSDDFTCTSEEVELLEFIKNRIKNLEERYKEMYVLRNEEVYKMYDFEHGRGFEPDFLLFLKGNTNNLYYQIFIEPKGEQFMDKEGGFKEGKEGWKEDFLLQITHKYGTGDLLQAESKKYSLIGLPLFNKEEVIKFEKAFSGQLIK